MVVNRTLRTISLAAGAVGAATAVRSLTDMWWLVIVVFAVTSGALYEIHRRDTKVAALPTAGVAAVAAVVLAGFALAAVFGAVPALVAWLGIAAFGVAWIEYPAALVAGPKKDPASAPS